MKEILEEDGLICIQRSRLMNNKKVPGDEIKVSHFLHTHSVARTRQEQKKHLYGSELLPFANLKSIVSGLVKQCECFLNSVFVSKFANNCAKHFGIRWKNSRLRHFLNKQQRKSANTEISKWRVANTRAALDVICTYIVQLHCIIKLIASNVHLNEMAIPNRRREKIHEAIDLKRNKAKLSTCILFSHANCRMFLNLRLCVRWHAMFIELGCQEVSSAIVLQRFALHRQHPSPSIAHINETPVIAEYTKSSRMRWQTEW